MIQSGNNILKIDIPIVFQGWESSLCKLQAYGWDIAISDCPMYMGYEFIFRNKTLHLYGMSDKYNIMKNLPEQLQYGNQGMTPIQINKCIAKEFNIQSAVPISYIGLQDAHLNVPTTLGSHGYKLSDMPYFDTIEGTPETILVDDNEVPNLLKEILDKQKNKQKEIREKLRKQNSKQNNSTVEAKIINLRG